MSPAERAARATFPTASNDALARAREGSPDDRTAAAALAEPSSPHAPEQPAPRTAARAELVDRLRLDATRPSRGGAWAGRAVLSAAVDELRAELARIGRSANLDGRTAGAEVAADAVAVLGELTARAQRIGPQPRAELQVEVLAARLDAALARARAQRPHGGAGAHTVANTPPLPAETDLPADTESAGRPLRGERG